MKRVREQMATHDVAIELTDEAKDLLVEQGYDPAMGARPLRRAIQRVIEDPLADFVLGRALEAGSTILVGRKRNDEGEPTSEVDITIIPGEVTPEKVTVPPEEPTDTADESDEPEPIE
jgi:ATP-dependent Clp protease ATP-binding subunit ClpC